MDKFVINGGKPLHGEVTISGAKNAAVAIVAATILCDEPCVLENVPEISDITICMKILSSMGAVVKLVSKNTVYFDTRGINKPEVPYELARSMRASTYFLGTLLGRFHNAYVAMPGGCDLGDRPIDQHLKAFRSLGAKLVNIDGDVFMHPLETRDVTAASIIRECTERNKGVETSLGKAVWLDTPMIEYKNGEGTIEKRIPAMMRMFGKYGIDIRKEPILVYPTLHYQNGGLNISDTCATDVENLFAAGEVAGGIHGRNRLMGNSLLDVIVFGRNAGINAAAKAKETAVPSKLTLDHIEKFNKELEAAGVAGDTASPMLLPHYARKDM